ncbi:hypothetical protein SLA2020_415420 [Shorea laevis]
MEPVGNDKALEPVDSFIKDSCLVLGVLRCIHLGLLCVQDNVDNRPTMSNVIFMLSNETTPKQRSNSPSQKQPTFAINMRTCYVDPILVTTETNISSVNKVTLIVPDAR